MNEEIKKLQDKIDNLEARINLLEGKNKRIEKIKKYKFIAITIGFIIFSIIIYIFTNIYVNSISSIIGQI